jgi:hypothetical protein
LTSCDEYFSNVDVESKGIWGGGVGVGKVYNATFNNISVISWQSVLLVDETKVPGENHRLAASH